VNAIASARNIVPGHRHKPSMTVLQFEFQLGSEGGLVPADFQRGGTSAGSKTGIKGGAPWPCTGGAGRAQRIGNKKQPAGVEFARKEQKTSLFLCREWPLSLSRIRAPFLQNHVPRGAPVGGRRKEPLFKCALRRNCPGGPGSLCFLVGQGLLSFPGATGSAPVACFPGPHSKAGSGLRRWHPAHGFRAKKSLSSDASSFFSFFWGKKGGDAAKKTPGGRANPEGRRSCESGGRRLGPGKHPLPAFSQGSCPSGDFPAEKTPDEF